MKIKPKKHQFTEEFIINHADVVDWNYVTQNIVMCTNFSDEFFLRFNKIILWDIIYSAYKLTTEFVHKHQDKLKFIAWYNESNQCHRDNVKSVAIYADGRKEWWRYGVFIKGEF